MILLLILIITAAILFISLIAAIAVGGAVAIWLFGDVIVCLLVIVWLIKKLSHR